MKEIQNKWATVVTLHLMKTTLWQTCQNNNNNNKNSTRKHHPFPVLHKKHHSSRCCMSAGSEFSVKFTQAFGSNTNISSRRRPELRKLWFLCRAPLKNSETFAELLTFDPLKRLRHKGRILFSRRAELLRGKFIKLLLGIRKDEPSVWHSLAPATVDDFLSN